MTTTEHDVTDRTKGLGGTDAAGILGLSKWKTPLRVYRETIGELSPDDDVPKYLEWGKRHERAVLDKYCEVSECSVVSAPNTKRHPRHEFILANVDALPMAPLGHQEPPTIKKIVEAKTGYPRNQEQWEQWGPEGTDNMPIDYLCQIQHYLSVYEADVCDVPVLLNGCEFRIYVVKRDEEFIKTLVDREVMFWNEHVVPRRPPSPLDEADYKVIYPRDNGEAIEASGEVLSWVKRYCAWKKLENLATAKVKEIRPALVETLGEAARFVDGDGADLLTYRDQSSKRLNTKRLAADHPELVTKYTETKPMRVIRVKPHLAALVGEIEPKIEEINDGEE